MPSRDRYRMSFYYLPGPWIGYNWLLVYQIHAHHWGSIEICDPSREKGAYGFHPKLGNFFTVTVRELDFLRREFKISRRVHSLVKKFHCRRETSMPWKIEWKLSRREYRSENFHAVKSIGVMKEASRYMHKFLSPVVDFSINFDILQYQYDCWLFKIITGAVNASKASGCSPNRSLENGSFSKTFWQHQNLFLIDAVHQFGFPSLFITISPYEWAFPLPPFIEDIRNTYGKEIMEVPVLETLHIAHVLEQLVRGYLTGGNSNRWRTHVLCNVTSHLPRTWKHSSITSNFNNAARFTYTCWFGSRRCLLFVPIWCNVSVPWDNIHDVFLVANAKKYDKSCLQVNNAPDAFITDANGRSILQFQDTDDDTQRNIRAYITTLLGALKCCTRRVIGRWQSHVTQIRELLRHQDSRIANVGRPIL